MRPLLQLLLNVPAVWVVSGLLCSIRAVGNRNAGENRTCGQVSGGLGLSRNHLQFYGAALLVSNLSRMTLLLLP